MGTSAGRQPPVLLQLDALTQRKCFDLLLSGKPGSVGQVAKLANVSRQVVTKFKKLHLQKAVEASRKVFDAQRIQLPPLERVRQQIELSRDLVAAQHLTDPFIARIEQLRNDRERIKKVAETDKDLRAWSSLDKNDLTELELHARLAGRLDNSPTTSVSFIALHQEPAPDCVTLDILPLEP